MNFSGRNYTSAPIFKKYDSTKNIGVRLNLFENVFELSIIFL